MRGQISLTHSCRLNNVASITVKTCVRVMDPVVCEERVILRALKLVTDYNKGKWFGSLFLKTHWNWLFRIRWKTYARMCLSIYICWFMISNITFYRLLRIIENCYSENFTNELQNIGKAGFKMYWVPVFKEYFNSMLRLLWSHTSARFNLNMSYHYRKCHHEIDFRTGISFTDSMIVSYRTATRRHRICVCVCLVVGDPSKTGHSPSKVQ